MKKYLFVVPSLSKGGAERVVSILASELVNQGREAVVLTYFKTTQDYPVDPRVKILCLSGGMESDYEKIGSLKRLALMRQMIMNEKPDFIVPFLVHVCLQTWIACWFTKQQIVYTVRNNPAKAEASIIHKRIQEYLIEHSKVTIVQNEDQRRYYSLKAQKHIYVLPNPVSRSFFALKHIQREGKKKIVVVGRLEKQKNYPMLINAIAAISQQRNDFVVEIYGDGSLWEELHAAISSKELAERIHMMGRIPDTRAAYENADVFVLTSDFEGMPNSLMEAMASEVTCISTDCPTGPSDLIEDHRNGLLIDVGDTSALIESLTYCLDHHEESRQFAERARKKVAEKYMPENIVRRLIRILE